MDTKTITKIYRGIHGTTMVEMEKVNNANNIALDFFRLFSAWGDDGKLFPSLNKDSTDFLIECEMDFLEMAKSEEMQRAFKRMNLKVIIPNFTGCTRRERKENCPYCGNEVKLNKPPLNTVCVQCNAKHYGIDNMWLERK